jgi:hypothetical protein
MKFGYLLQPHIGIVEIGKKNPTFKKFWCLKVPTSLHFLFFFWLKNLQVKKGYSFQYGFNTRA